MSKYLQGNDTLSSEKHIINHTHACLVFGYNDKTDTTSDSQNSSGTSFQGMAVLHRTWQAIPEEGWGSDLDSAHCGIAGPLNFHVT